LEALLEEAHIKLSSLVSDLLGASARRMLKELADGETDPAALASLADKNLRATSAQLCDALGACTELNPVYRQLLRMFLQELQLIDQQIGQLDKEMATLLSQDQAAVERLAEVPGLGVNSAQQIIAEVGAKAAPFASAKHLSSWVGACPGEDESAGVSKSHRLPEGQPPYAAPSQSVCQRRSQVERNHFPDRLWPTGVAPRTQSNHRGHCPSALSPDLDHSAPWCALRRTRPCSERKVNTQAH
jgi:Transposase IS116/IS110/IS902 family